MLAGKVAVVAGFGDVGKGVSLVCTYGSAVTKESSSVRKLFARMGLAY